MMGSASSILVQLHAGGKGLLTRTKWNNQNCFSSKDTLMVLPRLSSVHPDIQESNSQLRKKEQILNNTFIIKIFIISKVRN